MIAALVLAALPLRLMPEAPFPHVVTAPRSAERVTPGVEYARYDMTTALGPMVVHVLAIAPNQPHVRVDSVLAHDALTSSGETISSMAQRTGAIAGINGDYFDIGATNQPTNVVVSNHILLRTPRKRFALFVTNQGPEIAETSFTGQLQIGDRTFAIDAVNEMLPPRGGISLLTPQYGSVAPNESLTLLALKQGTGTPPFTTYTVVNQANNLSRQPAGYYVAIGPTAIATTGVPNPGDTVVATGDLDPMGLSNVQAAVGGGPLILADGKWYDDLDGPRGGTYSMRAPQSGAALTPDGTLLLVEVDGRQPDESVGVTPEEFSALMRAFGATRGMEFDSGGSSEMSVRIPGNTAATLVNSPSDGKERPVSDGVFVYSDAPVTTPAQIVAQPQAVRALVGAHVPVRFATVDASDHPVAAPGAIQVDVDPASLGAYADGTFIARGAGSGNLIVHRGALVSRIPIDVDSNPARIVILPHEPMVDKNGRIALEAHAYDDAGYELALPAHLPWRANTGIIDGMGLFSAGSEDAVISLLIGDHLANARISVGFRELALPFTDHAHFMTAPKGGDGATSSDCSGCVDLRYALGKGERAAYAVADTPLPPRSAGVAFDVRDDGSGAHLKVALHNALNEEVLLPATVLDEHGWRHVVVRFPQSLFQPARLTAIYVIGAAPGEEHAGTIEIKDVKAVVGGSE
ncbi:MAG: phosphodiester glycosidase family protein [Candidatus Eremiobacteraeota bacterium]|nr:phosphodiester glycosidase family protein [Candidatus Eremiobacteraeota bacterium]